LHPNISTLIDKDYLYELQASSGSRKEQQRDGKFRFSFLNNSPFLVTFANHADSELFFFLQMASDYFSLNVGDLKLTSNVAETLSYELG